METTDEGTSATPCELRAMARLVPNLSGEDQRLALSAIDQGQRDGAVRIARIALFMCALTVPFTVYLYFTFDPLLAQRLAVVVAVITALEATVAIRLWRGLYHDWMNWASAIIEVSIPTAVLAVDAVTVHPAYALTSAPLMLYGPVVIITCLRLQPRLCLLVGALAGGELFASYLLLRAQLDPATVAANPALSFSNQLQRAVYVAGGGLAAYWVSVVLLRLLGDLVKSVRQEVRVRSILGTQVTPEVAQLLLHSTGRLGEKREITVLFSDIRGFTSFSEKRDPVEVVDFLNQYFAEMCTVVEQHGGIVNKFLGDGLMALWGAPVARGDHASAAARAALAMVERVEAMKAKWNHPGLEIGIGIHTGPAVVGIIGSSQRSEYTAIGDAVNLASRIEGLNKQFGTRVLASEETKRLLQDGIEARRVGEAAVKGREQPVVAWELQPKGPATTAVVGA
ncbi:MAG: adenylate/guanylate cyclase domain-containing protein [Myxococcales bacterium]